MRTALSFSFVVMMVVGCSRPNALPPDGLPIDVGPGAVADKKQFQGIWAVESIETADPKDKPTPDQISGVRFIFEGNTFRVYEKGRTYQDRFAFALDTTGDPKAVILTELDEDDRPVRNTNGPSQYTPATVRYSTAKAYSTSRTYSTSSYSTSRGGDMYGSLARIEWIYKFEGESLVLAFSRGMTGKRPASFKPEAGTPSRDRGATKSSSGGPYQPGVPATLVVRLKRVDEPLPPVVKRPRYGSTSYGTYRGTSYSTRPYPAGTYRGATKR